MVTHANNWQDENKNNIIIYYIKYVYNNKYLEKMLHKFLGGIYSSNK